MKRTVKLVAAMILIASPAVFANLAVDLDTIVVTNARFGQKEYRIPSNVTVVTRQQIEASSARTIADLLKSAQGVNIYDNSTNKSAVIDIRGFGDTASRNVLVLINARKVNAIDVSGPDLGQIALGSVERIEIIRGAGSVLYGDNAVGGVVNIITKKGSGDLRGKVGAVYGSYDSLGEHLEFSGAHKDFSYFLYSKYFDQKGYRENSDELSKDFNTRLGYAFSQNFSADLEMSWHKDDSGLPGGLSSGDLKNLGRRASTNPDDFSSTKDRYAKLGFVAKPWISDIDFGDFSLDLLYRNRDTFDSFNTYGAYHTNRSIDTYGFAGKYVFDRLVFGKEVNFITGIDYYDHANDIVGSAQNPDDITIKKKEFGAYESLQYELVNRLFVITGTRYHNADYGFHQRNVVVNENRSPDQWVSSAGLKYEYSKGSNLHFNWQQTFRFLSTDEWYSTLNAPGYGITPGLNLDLKQQSGVQYEIGLKHNFYDAVVVGITPYLLVNNNEIFFDPAASKNNNYDKTRRAGIEFDQRVDFLRFFDFRFLDKLELIMNYKYQNARFDKGLNDGNYIPMVAMHEAFQSVLAGFFQYYQVSLTNRFVGARFAINDVQNSMSMTKPYDVVDAKLTYKKKNYEIYAAVNNVFDEEYFSYVAKSAFSSDMSFFPSPQRNYTLGVDIKF